MAANVDFLEKLLDAHGPSGFEVRPARVWRTEAEGFADEVLTQVNGNSVASINPGGSPRVMMAGHIDEIGLQITHIDEQGYLYVAGIGGWDPQVLVGQRVVILGREGDVRGVIGKKPIHLIPPEEREKVTKVKSIWIDVGAADRASVVALGLRVGDPAVIDQGMLRLAGDRIASRAIDNRIGAFVVLEALRLLSSLLLLLLRHCSFSAVRSLYWSSLPCKIYIPNLTKHLSSNLFFTGPAIQKQ